MSEITERVRKMVAEQLGVEVATVLPESRFVEDLNADSLDVVELVMKVEEVFGGVSISDEEAQEIRTVGDMVAFLEKKLGG
ncbi:MAG TPA: acyl carrier protein [Phycisphaerae bacterium]|jgi:acyl carrier protein|nr:acyl carrier protein [Phycisphaerae bacterium]